MLGHIRLATPEEIESIRDNSDLMPGGTQVLTMDGIKAVVRNPVEINPVHFPEGCNDVKKARFMWALEERLLGAGVDRYYIQADSSDSRWQKVLKEWGFEQVSPIPEYRMLRVLR